MTSKPGSELPNAYAGLTNLGLAFVTVVLTVATAHHHAWALTVFLAFVAVLLVCTTVAWIRSLFRGR